MIAATRRLCHYVPRKCRGLLLIGCFMCFVLTIMLVGQVSVVLAGMATREIRLTEDKVRDAIPMQKTIVFSDDRQETMPVARDKVGQQQRRNLRPLSAIHFIANQSMGIFITNQSMGIGVGAFCHTYEKLDYLLAMRIPKSASTSMVDLLQSLSKKKHIYLYFNPSGAYDWDDQRKLSVAGKLIGFKKSVPDTPITYSRHFYHVDFAPYGLKNYKYATIVRDPVDRFVSSYLYYHFSSKGYIQAALNPKHRDETIIECLQSRHEGCATNLMTKYFCGHERFCKDGSAQAALRARENLLKDFAVVGVLEELKLSYQVFKKVLPQYFGTIEPAAAAAHVSNSNRRTLNLTSDVREAIATANSADMELYHFARQLLHEQASGCGLQN